MAAAIVAAVRAWPMAIRWATLEVRDWEEAVLAAVEIDGGLLTYASQRLKRDRATVLASLRSGCNIMAALSCIPDAFYDDEEIMAEAVRHASEAFWLVSASLRNDKDFMTQAVRTHGAAALTFASAALKADYDVVRASVERDGAASLFAVGVPVAFQEDKLLQTISARNTRADGPVFRGDLHLYLFASCDIAHEGESAPVVSIVSVKQRLEAHRTEVVLTTMAGRELTLSLQWRRSLRQHNHGNYEAADMRILALEASRRLECPRVHIVAADGTAVKPWNCCAPLLDTTE